MSTLEGIVTFDSSSTLGRPLKQGIFLGLNFVTVVKLILKMGTKRVFQAF
jgi:hypothetical protein